jgi:hypothetical protein
VSTHINKIVLVTRELSGIEAELDRATGDARAAAAERFQAAMNARENLILTAIRDGVDPDTMRWAIGMNDSAAKVQLQRATAHALAAETLDDGADDDDADEM